MSIAESPIVIPDSVLAQEATEFVRGMEPDLLYNHSLRVYAFGCLHGERRGLSYDRELLYLGALFHDIGLIEGHRGAHGQFQVSGANVAREFLAARGMSGDELRIVWDAVALHATPVIAQHKEPEVALVTAGVELDVLGFGYDDVGARDRAAVVAAFPRVDCVESLVQPVVNGIGEPYERPNLCALIRASKVAS